MTTPSGCSAWAQVDDLPTSAVGLHDEAQWCGYLAMATDILWAATGRRWRGGPLAAEAVLRAATPRPGEAGWPYSRTWGRCGCNAGASASGPRWADTPHGHHEPVAIRLPHPDVVAVSAVTVDGQPFVGWQLDGAWLTRTDGHGWSMCRDTTVVTYTYGRPPPDAARMACVELAVELGIAGADDPGEHRCRLPMRVQSLTRQGITYEAIDSATYLDEGLTGITSIDLWLRSVNPYGRRQAAQLWSPDIVRARRN